MSKTDARDRADFDFADLIYGDRRAVSRLDDDLSNLFGILNHPFAANNIGLTAMLDVAAAGDQIILFQSLEDAADRDAVANQFLGIDNDLILFGEAAHRIDFDYARHRPQPITNLPVEQGPQFHRRKIFTAHDKLIDLAEACA